MQGKIPDGVRIVALLFGGCLSLFAAPITLSVLPTNQSVGLGASVNVSLRISGLGNLAAPSLGTVDLDLGFDPLILSFSSAVFGDPILGDQLDPTGMGNTINFVNPGFGTVSLFDLSLISADQLNSLQADSFILASLEFNTISIGTSPLSLTMNVLGDADGASLTATIEDGSAVVTASEVPEPSSTFLVASAALAIAIWRRSFAIRSRGQ